MRRALDLASSGLRKYGIGCSGGTLERMLSTASGRVSVSASFPNIIPEEEGQGSESESRTSTSGRYEVETLDAIPRGKRQLKRHRKAGYVPGILFSLPGEASQPILLQSKVIQRLINNLGPAGVQSRLYNLRLMNGDSDEGTLYPVLAKSVHQTAGTLDLENISFMFCPPDRIVNVNVPVKVDVSRMDISERYYLDIFADLPTKVAVNEKYLDGPVCRMVGKARAAASS